MEYIDVRWIYSNADDPVRLVSELDADRYETRKLEFFLDGRVGYASKDRASDDTRLGKVPVPPLAEINAQAEFSGTEIPAADFGALWDEHVASQRQSVEALLDRIDREVTSETLDFELWVPTQLTFCRAGIRPDVAMAVVLDRLLARGLMPDGFTQAENGRVYRYKRPN